MDGTACVVCTACDSDADKARKACIKADTDDGQLMSFRLSPAAIEIGQLFQKLARVGL